MASDWAKTLAGVYTDPNNPNAKRALDYVKNSLLGKFTDEQVNSMVGNQYFKDIVEGGTPAALAKIYGGDQGAIAEATAKQKASGQNWFDYLDTVAASPDSYAPKWAERQATARAQATADTVASPLLENAKLQSDAAKTESRSYIDRLLAARGITSSGAVGANIAKSDLGYANALQSALSTIKSGALNNALGREQQVLDKNVAQTYADKINTQYMDAIKQGQTANQPTFWDYAGSILGGITGVAKAGGKSGLGIWG